MKKLIILILVIFFGFHLKVSAQVNSTIQGELSSLILEDNPEFYVQYGSTRELTDGLLHDSFSIK
jgi:hypothetical protein